MVIIAVVLLFIISNALQGANNQRIRSTVQRGNQRQAEQLRSNALAEIRNRDPAFNESAFLERTKIAFTKIQSAWSDQKLSAVRPFISDGVNERFQLQIQMMQAQNLRNVMTNVQVLSSEIAAAFHTEQFDTIHVRISARADDHNQDLKTGRRIPGTDHSGSFVEFWSFHRRPGTKSLKSAGSIEGNCPRCAAPLEIVDQAKCQACGALVNSGEYDWVLSEISQESEFQVPESEQLLPGLADLKQRDPGFNTLHIEDRVSVMFWRLRATEFYHDIKYAAPVMSKEMTENISNAMQKSQRYWKDAAVGQVELIDATSDGNKDYLRVKIRWSGILLNRVNGHTTELKSKSISTQVYTLFRNSSVQSSPAGTFTSAGCPQCGAPLQSDESGNCSYCGASLTTGKFDWVLQSIDRYTADVAHQHFTELETQRTAAATQPEGRPATDTPLAIAILAQAALIDGILDEGERTVLHQLGAHRGLTPEQVDEFIHQAQSHDAQLPAPRNPAEAMGYLRQLIHVFMADGVLSAPEKRLLSSYAHMFDLTALEVRQLVNQEQTRVYKSATRDV